MLKDFTVNTDRATTQLPLTLYYTCFSTSIRCAFCFPFLK